MTGFQWLIVWCVGGAVLLSLLGLLWTMFDDYAQSFLPALVCGILIGGIVLFFGWAFYFDLRLQCEQKRDAMHLEGRWGSRVGCLIEDGDRLVPLENYMRNEESTR